MNPIPLIIYCCQLGLVGIILWYVIEAIGPMPAWAKTTAQSLLALILILVALQAVIFGPPYGPVIPR